ACYRTVERRHWLRMRVTALGLTIMLAVALLAAVILLIVGQIALNYILSHLEDFSHLNLDNFTIYILFVLRFVVIFTVFFLAISFIYYFGPAVHYNWSFFSAGSFLATLAILGLSYGFSVYITNFGNYNKLYGSIGALIALMAWIQLVTIILLYGYEINASLHYGRKMEVVSNFQRSQRLEKAMR
ncbi:MAG: YihY/virulence factor BrkB family protein, partial [Cytophagales bacterium]